MNLRYIIFLIFALASVGVGYSQEGYSAYSFLEVPSSRHAFALGGTTPNVIDDDINLV